MTRNLWVAGIAAGMVFGLTGCGSSATNNNEDNTSSGNEAYYVDSAVVNVSYKCGSIEGITGEDGKFNFETGKGCTFSIAGVPLRDVKPGDLGKGKKIVEDDADVARFLQSIDQDGDPSNGIQISDDVLEVLKDALKGKTEIPAGDDVGGVVQRIKDKVPAFKGKVKSAKEVAEHLKKTKAKIVKELLAGKTVYDVSITNKSNEIEEVTFNGDFTKVTTNGETYPITLSGSVYTVGDSSVMVQDIKEDYVQIIQISSSGGAYVSRLYFDKQKAEAFKNSGESNADDVVKKAFEGKTLYRSDTIVNIDSNETTTYSFFFNNGTMTVSQNGIVLDIEITYGYVGNDGLLLTWKDESGKIRKELYKVVSVITDKSVALSKIEDDQPTSKTVILYHTESDAKNNSARH